MRLIAIAISAVGLAVATAAAAQPVPASTTQDDARCLLEMVALSNAEDANAQRMGQGGVTYFAGRITAREPNFDFARLKSMAATMDMRTAQSDLQQRCGPMFQRSMQQLATALAPPAGAAQPSAPRAAPPPKH